MAKRKGVAKSKPRSSRVNISGMNFETVLRQMLNTGPISKADKKSKRAH